tara:strand:- start:2191 stop:2472 length:282 start_codon:yes stop_codon:yes gene_type:complete
MTVQEIMDRLGMDSTGKAIAYIKDGLDEMNLLSETHTKTTRIDINKDQRFYNLPNEAVKILDIRCKHHNNQNSRYESIPRSIYEPETEDSDGI